MLMYTILGTLLMCEVSKRIVYEPFLRWAGGKRWLAKKLSPFLHQTLMETKGTYFEPFLGAGAMFFCLAPPKSYLSDINHELIQTYITVGKSWREVETVMKKWKVTSEQYYQIRAYKPRTEINKAARFIWLNRVCYGGLYRVNKNNGFNVPFGGGSRTPQILYRNEILKKAALIMNFSNSSRKVRIEASDFEKIINESKSGDLIYCDPTYSNVGRGQFDRYGSVIFDWNDQLRLALVAQKAYDRGVTVLISNGYFPELIELYPNAYRIKQSKQKTIGNIPGDQNNHKEYLFILDPKNRDRHWDKYSKSINSNF